MTRSTRYRRAMAIGIVMLALPGCGGHELAERLVPDVAHAEEMARGRVAYQLALRRVDGVEPQMSVDAVEAAMGAVVAIEQREGADGGIVERRHKLIEGLLCVMDASPKRQRWLFGYDEGRVVLVGFAVEFGREDVDDDWTVRHVDRAPEDGCSAP